MGSPPPTHQSEPESEEEEEKPDVKVEDSDDSEEEEEEEEEEGIEDELQVDSSILYIKSREEDHGGGVLLQDPLELNNPVLPHISAKCKPEFAVEMQKGVNGVVQECVQVLKKDPREYHPFYLTVDRFVQFGLRQKYIPEGMEGLMWEKVDKFASSEYVKACDKSTNSNSTTAFRGMESQYLKHILQVGRSKAGRKIIIPPKLERDFRVALRSSNKMLEDGEESPPGSQYNLKCRLEFFRHFQLVTSPESVVPMNILWSRLLSPPRRNPPTGNDQPCSSDATHSRQKITPAGIEQKAKGAGRQQVPSTKSKLAQVKATQGNNNQQSLETPEEKAALQRAKRNERERARRRKETPEEAELRRAKRNERERARRRKSTLATPTHYADDLKKQNERRRLRREMETPDEAELRRAKRNERDRWRRRRKETPEEREARLAKRWEEEEEEDKINGQKETPEEAEFRRAKDREGKRMRRGQETLEEAERRRARDRERAKMKRRQETPEEAERRRARRNESQRQRDERDRARRRQTETPEQPEAQLAGSRENGNNGSFSSSWKNKWEGLSEEERQKIRERKRASAKALKARMTEEQRQEAKVKQYMAYVARRARWGKEGLQYMREYSRRWRANLSGEKRAAYMEYLRMKGKERLERLRADPQKWREHNEKMLEYQREKTRRETPQARHNRLTRYKINQAKQRLRKEMESNGDFNEEEFQKRAEELISKIKIQAEASAPLMISEYKERPRKRQTCQKLLESANPEDNACLEARRQPGCDALLPPPFLPLSLPPSSSFSCSVHGGSLVTPPPPDELVVANNNASQPGAAVAAHSQPETQVQLESDDFDDDQAMMEDGGPLGSPEHSHSPLDYDGIDEDNNNCSSEEGDQVPASSSVTLTPTTTTSPSTGECVQEDQIIMQSELTTTTGTGQGSSCEQDSNYKAHQLNNNFEFECEECPARFETGEELRSHLGSQHSSTCWRCPECQQVVLSPAELKLHFQELHE